MALHLHLSLLLALAAALTEALAWLHATEGNSHHHEAGLQCRCGLGQM